MFFKCKKKSNSNEKIPSLADFENAGVICRTFPEHPLLLRVDYNMPAFELETALWFARVKHKCKTLGDALKWARKTIEIPNDRGRN